MLRGVGDEGTVQRQCNWRGRVDIVTVRLRHRFSASADPLQVHLRVLATTDMHVHIRSYDYYADQPDLRFGLAKTIALARLARAEADNAVLVDNGDFLQGNPMGDFYGPNPRRRLATVHPAIAAMNAAEYDAVCLGNHEFNYGLDFLASALADAQFPVVAANLATRLGATAADDQTLTAPYVILDRMVRDGAGGQHPLRIGVIGLLPPQVMLWDRTLLEGRVAIRDMVETARVLVPKMRAEGADIVIALCHGGIGPAVHVPGGENAAIPVAAIAGVDAIVAGHTHGVFPTAAFEGWAGVDVARGIIGGKPGVMAGMWGSHLGIIDLLLRRDGATWQVVEHESQARAVAGSGVQDDPAIRAAVTRHHRNTLRHIRRPIGETAIDLHSYLSLIAPDAALKLVADAQRDHARMLLVDRSERDLPILSAVAPFKSGRQAGPDFYTHVRPGRMSYRSAADLYTFPNSVRILQIDGHSLRNWLEHAAGAFLRVTPVQTDQPLIDTAFPGYSFDVIHGVTYAIDPSQPRRFSPHGQVENAQAARIVDLRHDGRLVQPDDRFVIVTNNYRADGGDFAALADATPIPVPPVANRDLLVRHIRRSGTVMEHPEPVWRFAPLPGTSALFETGPKVLPLLPQVRGVTLTEAGMTEAGFARLRISF